MHIEFTVCQDPYSNTYKDKLDITKVNAEGANAEDTGCWWWG